MTEKDKQTVKAVFSALLEKPFNELNTFLGSLTIEEMQKLYNRLKYEPYCLRRGIKYEDMTEDDFMQAYEDEFNDEYEEYEE